MKNSGLILILLISLSSCIEDTVPVESSASVVQTWYKTSTAPQVDQQQSPVHTVAPMPEPASNRQQVTTQLTVALKDLSGQSLAQVAVQLDEKDIQYSNQRGVVMFDDVPIGKHDVHILSEKHEWVSLYQTNHKNILWQLAALEDSYLQFQGSIKNFDPTQAGHRLELVFLQPSAQMVLGRSYCHVATDLFRCIGVLSGIAVDQYTALDVWAIERDLQQRVVSSQKIAYNFVYYAQNINNLSIAYAHNIQFPQQAAVLQHMYTVNAVNPITGANNPLVEVSAFAPGGHGVIVDVQSTSPTDLYAAIQQQKVWAIALATTLNGGFWSLIQKVNVATQIDDMYATLTGSGTLQAQTFTNPEHSNLSFTQLTDRQSIQKLLIREPISARTLWKIYFAPEQHQVQLPKLIDAKMRHRLAQQQSYSMQLQLWKMSQFSYDQALVHMGQSYGLSLHQRIEIISSGMKVLQF